MSQHTIGDLPNQNPSEKGTRFPEMQACVELVTLQSAFGWLQTAYPLIYGHVVEAMADVLECERDLTSEWPALIREGWDTTIWCLWVHIVVTLSLQEAQDCAEQFEDVVGEWINHMLR